MQIIVYIKIIKFYYKKVLYYRWHSPFMDDIY